MNESKAWLDNAIIEATQHWKHEETTRGLLKLVDYHKVSAHFDTAGMGYHTTIVSYVNKIAPGGGYALQVVSAQITINAFRDDIRPAESICTVTLNNNSVSVSRGSYVGQGKYEFSPVVVATPAELVSRMLETKKTLTNRGATDWPAFVISLVVAVQHIILTDAAKTSISLMGDKNERSKGIYR